MKSKAAIYIRVSTTDQAESGYSLQAQEALCRQYCAEHDYSVVGVYAD
jgi:site-specific DNA recombinase